MRTKQHSVQLLDGFPQNINTHDKIHNFYTCSIAIVSLEVSRINILHNNANPISAS